jgi:hypothetical protein
MIAVLGSSPNITKKHSEKNLDIVTIYAVWEPMANIKLLISAKVLNLGPRHSFISFL